MEILQAVKTSMLMTADNELIDAQLSILIEACKNELLVAGIKKIVDTDPLIAQAIILYVKRDMNYRGNGDKFGTSYELLKLSLRLSGDYSGEQL